MKNINKFLYLLLLLLIPISSTLLLTSCLPAPDDRSDYSVKSKATPTTTPTPTPTPSIIDPKVGLYWYTNENSKLDQTLILDANVDSIVAFLKGSLLGLFLAKDKNYENIYCLVFDFNQNTQSSVEQLRVRAVSMSKPSANNSTSERTLRIDFGKESENVGACAGAIPNYNGSATISTSPQVAFTPSKICSGCSLASSSVGIRLYQSNAGTTITESTKISSDIFDISRLGLTINPESDTNDEDGICIESDCIAKGFTCCSRTLQCIKDGAERPGASTKTDYALAIQQVNKNPALFTDWPEIFYNCAAEKLPDPTPTAPPSADELAGKNLQFLKELYFCLDYKEGDSDDDSYCKPTYNDVKNIVWHFCGCATVGTPAPDDPENTCPQYGLDALDANQLLLSNVTPGHVFTSKLPLNTENSKTKSYLRGSDLHAFLGKSKNDEQNYCLVINYNLGATSSVRQLRVNATAMTFPSYPSTAIERVLYINLFDIDNNSTSCNGTINAISSNREIAYRIGDVCPTCSSTSISSSMALYVSTNGTVSDNSKVSSTALNFDPLQLHLNKIDISLTPASEENLYWFSQTSDKIRSVKCRTIPEDDSDAFKDHDVYIPGRTAPNRFFLKSTGKEVPDISKIKGTPEAIGSPIAEGDEFYYIDPTNKLGSMASSYSMNALLGQLRIDLSMSRPAVEVDVKQGESYIIGVVNGLYTPCPTCAKDSWFPSFSAFPASQYGTGVQALGYTTSPDTYSGNFSGGNYEDTHFGRACWVPPTMIPFSHNKNSNVQKQRLNRLKTQAAFYTNGYKRDWYGFNQGALIGSFNGVTWFAIGKNRRVQASSHKLYLAINAPFADLALDESGYKVNIMTDNGFSQIPSLDFDPELNEAQYSLQNEAGTCQRYHFCEKDADCITRLGWEYMCVKTDRFRSLIPSFDVSGDEIADKAISARFSKIIHGNLPSIGEKRCVYRGSGAPCVQNYATISDAILRKQFTCAPNFYCAGLQDAAFNEGVKREPNNLGAILFGQKANVLGRPLNYLGNKSLESEIQENIKANAKIQDKDLSDEIGMCRPGKYISYSGGDPNPLLSHSKKDSLKRTDYLSQIGACNSDANNSVTSSAEKLGLALQRVGSCPVLDKEGNYYYTQIRYDSTNQEITTLPSTLYGDILAQNSCGKESIYEGVSNFAQAEAGTYSSLNTLPNPAIPRDACLRRAGSVCHTKYDCSPNSIQSKATQQYPYTNFGGNEAEYRYWMESLTCEQMDPVNASAKKDPTLEATTKKERLPNARCCRPTGESFTMYTEGDIKTLDNNPTLKTDPDSFAIKGPRDEGRYSRYTVVPSMQITDPTDLSTPIPTWPKVVYTPTTGELGEQRPLKFQWKTVHDTAQKNCCGGWIRKFANSSFNWMNPNRLNFNPDNFKCLNFRSFLTESTEPPAGLPLNTPIYDQEKGVMCTDPANFGCAHYMAENSSTEASTETIIPPKEMSIETCTSYADCKVISSGGVYLTLAHSFQRAGYLHDLVPFPPRLSPRIKTIFPTNILDSCKSCTFVGLTTGAMSQAHRGLILDMPSYINGLPNITKLYLSRIKKSDGTSSSSSSSTAPTFQSISESPYELGPLYPSRPDYTCAPDIETCLSENANCPFIGASYSTDAQAPAILNAMNNDTEGWCYDTTKGLIYIKRHFCHAFPSAEDTGAGVSCKTKTGYKAQSMYHDGSTYENTVGALIEFRPMGFKTHLNGSGGAVSPEGLTPGNDLYYLEKLARFELLGIPQIYYEPIYCNNNRNNLVPGLFDTTEDTRTGFGDISFQLGAEQKDYNGTAYLKDASIYSDSSLNNEAEVGNLRATLDDKVLMPSIFSSYEFRCCKRLGGTTKDYRTCCSGFSGPMDQKTQLYTCKLPLRTDINLYFNRFVSGEGSYSDLSDTMRLNDEDFDPQTGYPKIESNQKVIQKLILLGKAFCNSGKVFTGAAYGHFGWRPRPYAVISDSPFPYGIVYGPDDVELAPTTTGDSAVGSRGTVRFNNGRRWNHHLYCGETP